nr:Chain P, SYNDECAN-4 [Homo sapiens]1OBY_Q Chain Q, SYNDECAN-4 [Homo sapiens]
TNEFYA